MSYHLRNGLRIWKKAQSGNHPVTLDLRLDACGCAIVCAVDENGDVVSGGYLAYISLDGVIGRFRAVDESLGFHLNEQGQIVEGSSR